MSLQLSGSSPIPIPGTLVNKSIQLRQFLLMYVATWCVLELVRSFQRRQDKILTPCNCSYCVLTDGQFLCQMRGLTRCLLRALWHKRCFHSDVLEYSMWDWIMRFILLLFMPESAALLLNRRFRASPFAYRTYGTFDVEEIFQKKLFLQRTLR